VDAASVNALKSLQALESVCCLECGEIYAKPVGGGTVLTNPGCPECGYLGWIPLSLPGEPRGLRRSGADRQRPHSARSR
jgi:predicted  nucleic acid-binding Zn-ribbon protein